MGNLIPFNQAIEKHKSNLEKFKPEFAKVLPPHITPDRIARSVLNALASNQYLATSCDPTSIIQSAMTAAVLGLEVDNALGQGYIVPYRGKAQFIPGYKGYITLAQNSGYLISGDVVREKDKFFYERGLDPKLEHVPAPGGASERGPIVYAYAVARSKNMPSDFKVVHIEFINEIRDGSEGYKAFMKGKIKDTPWVNHYEAMAIKTAIRQLAPELPLNVQRAAAIESAFDRGHTSYINDMKEVHIVNGDSQPQYEQKTTEQPNMVNDLNLGGENES